MSASLAPTTPHLTELPPLREAVPEEWSADAASAANHADAELRRWLIGLTTPFVLGALFFALSIGTSAHWLIGVSLALGPVLFMFMCIYLCISSDSNGAALEVDEGKVVRLA